MASSPNTDLSPICQGILRYLHDHPGAADSLEGITSWWLAPSDSSVSAEGVRQALALLVAERRIARIDLADGRTLFQSVDKISGSHPAWKPKSVF